MPTPAINSTPLCYFASKTQGKIRFFDIVIGFSCRNANEMRSQ